MPSEDAAQPAAQPTSVRSSSLQRVATSCGDVELRINPTIEEHREGLGELTLVILTGSARIQTYSSCAAMRIFGRALEQLAAAHETDLAQSAGDDLVDAAAG